MKSNLQLPENSPEARELGELVLAALERSPLFISAVLPQRVFPPLFNRYDGGMNFGSHVDNAIRPITRDAAALAHRRLGDALPLSVRRATTAASSSWRTPTAATRVKLPAGDLIIYPATSLHHVTPVTRGVAARVLLLGAEHDPGRGQRSLLFDLDTAIMQLNREVPKSPSLMMLTGVYHNLLRQWSEP